jgi:thiamine biosynthesis lipoprotein
MSVVQRARPWLGTLVRMRVEGLDEARARTAIDRAFAEVEMVHRCMSFHAADSDLARLHAAQAGEGVAVDARTHEVLACALRIAELSDGCFDPTIAARQVALGLLPRPARACAPDPRATWRDIELLSGNRARLHKPLWLDLGGIAKGYAVDRALAVLIHAGAAHALVDAGGDLRVAGRSEIVHLRGAAPGGAAGTVCITDAAVASSSGAIDRRRAQRTWIGAHLHGRSGAPVGTFSSASVVAPTCMVADALTKVVLAASPAVRRRALAACDAQAATHSVRHGWRSFGVAA